MRRVADTVLALAFVLFLLAVICAAFATCGVTAGRVNLLAAAVLFLALALAVPTFQAATV